MQFSYSTLEPVPIETAFVTTLSPLLFFKRIEPPVTDVDDFNRIVIIFERSPGY